MYQTHYTACGCLAIMQNGKWYWTTEVRCCSNHTLLQTIWLGGKITMGAIAGDVLSDVPVVIHIMIHKR